MTSVPGARFSGTVEHAGSDVAAQPEEKLKLPDGTFAFLTSLPRPTDAADQAELKYLLGARFELNERTLKYAESRIAAWHVDTETAHEAAKLAVREQNAVIAKLAANLYEDTQAWVSADNARRQAESAVGVAEREYKSLSRFASKKEITEAEKRIELAQKNSKAAETKAGEWFTHLNVIKAITVPAEQKKLAALMEAELELAAQLAGKDPVLAKFGLQQR